MTGANVSWAYGVSGMLLVPRRARCCLVTMMKDSSNFDDENLSSSPSQLCPVMYRRDNNCLSIFISLSCGLYKPGFTAGMKSEPRQFISGKRLTFAVFRPAQITHWHQQFCLQFCNTWLRWMCPFSEKYPHAVLDDAEFSTYKRKWELASEKSREWKRVNLFKLNY